MSVKRRILGFTLLLLFILPQGAGAVSWSHNLFSKMIGKDPDQYELSWQKIFSKEENFGQDLYLKTYQSMVYAPDNAVKREVAQAYGLSLQDTEDVLGGSITPLLQSEKYSQTFTQDQAFTMAYNIQKTFSDKLAIANLKSEFDAQTVPTEIFANGDLSDSGFDLISDLDVIEYYLFVDKTPNTVNKTLPGGKTTPQKITYQEPVSSGATWNRLLAANTVFDTQENQCVIKTPLDTAITNYEDQPGNSSGNNSSGSSGESGTSGDASAQNADSAPLSDPFVNPPELETIPVFSAENNFPQDSSLCADSWDGHFVYGSKGPKEFSANANNTAFTSFCFAITTKGGKKADGTSPESTSSSSAFYPEKPCINCTIAAMNQSLKETVSHSLVPSKLTGNIFESAKCKEGVNLSDLFDLNIFVVPMPILTPPKYGAYEGHDIAQEFDLFAKKYLPLSQAQKDQQKDDPATPISDKTEDQLLDEQATAQCLSYGSENMTQVDLLECINEIVASEKGRVSSEVSEKMNAIRLQTSSEFYQPIEQELEQMRTFFQIFKDMFSELQTKTCPNLNNKIIIKLRNNL